MDFPAIRPVAAVALETFPHIEAHIPSEAIAVSGDLLYPDFRAREFRDLLSVVRAVLVWTAGIMWTKGKSGGSPLTMEAAGEAKPG